jgi:succinyl-CoA synthetase beta subunit
MLLIEADGKALLRAAGIRTPDGVLVTGPDDAPALPGRGPWMVKAQAAVGGRGKAGGILRCDTEAAVRAAARRLLVARIKGHDVQCCLVETAIAGSEEYYLSLMIDPVRYGVRSTLLREGGVEVERTADIERHSRVSAPDAAAIAAAIHELASGEPEPRRNHLAAAGERLAQLFVARELMLAEINPLFVGADGCVAGDAKLVIDLNAVHRQPELAALIARHAAIYPDAQRKLNDGFDYVEVDPEGEIGLVTTGAGLSMMLIDELTARGGRPLNFCDIRTGMLRGNPTRLIRVLEWIAARPSARVVLVNVFAGITDLREFAELLCVALERTPAFRLPLVARLIGNGFAEARGLLAEKRPDIAVEEALDAALARVDALLRRAPS